ncbi:cytochrome c [Hymenobacter sp. HDW8]|nr:cytochrome c [Hymenobacter sp. HDW8]
MRVTSEGLERVPDSIAMLYIPTLDSLPKNLSKRENLSGADAIAVVSGEALFLGNCAQCHAINDVVVGPALKNIHKRRPVSWLIPWIQNSSKMVASGDEYAVKIYNQYQKQEMPSFALTDTEIKQVIKYLEVASAEENWVIN